MNGKLKDFINGIGAIVEMWTVVYGQFINHGYSPKDALAHTESFIRATIVPLAGLQNKGEEE